MSDEPRTNKRTFDGGLEGGVSKRTRIKEKKSEGKSEGRERDKKKAIGQRKVQDYTIRNRERNGRDGARLLQRRYERERWEADGGNREIQEP